MLAVNRKNSVLRYGRFTVPDAGYNRQMVSLNLKHVKHLQRKPEWCQIKPLDCHIQCRLQGHLTSTWLAPKRVIEFQGSEYIYVQATAADTAAVLARRPQRSAANPTYRTKTAEPQPAKAARSATWLLGQPQQVRLLIMFTVLSSKQAQVMALHFSQLSSSATAVPAAQQYPAADRPLNSALQPGESEPEERRTQTFQIRNALMRSSVLGQALGCSLAHFRLLHPAQGGV